MNFPVRRGSGDTMWPRPSWGMVDPWHDFENVWSQMGRFLGQASGPAGAGHGWMPMAEEEETDEAYVIKAELPGVPRDNINVEVDGNDLCITGEMDEKSHGKVLAHLRGRFSYRSSMPSGIDSEHIEAGLDHGVLTVRIPKSGESKPRRIGIVEVEGEGKSA
ncbi:Hsp20/alpha crystallin family protein [Streptomyces sp. ZAF1911]|uniref:Hsp20/alpha crystallin family protein n=1 Tax=Streptomyces sp. ZAF1911 TaxID=2944129 RepID=UPI00237A5DEB|nr:Hsp20/alpha crystallin family protein [Streptomyces sp. ZAF1911]MDD9380406.1 Hsp20/alpha crystallin family protein [Streptomyces sp. ZAF1911]